jgi:hypothetical protein
VAPFLGRTLGLQVEELEHALPNLGFHFAMGVPLRILFEQEQSLDAVQDTLHFRNLLFNGHLYTIRDVRGVEQAKAGDAGCHLGECCTWILPWSLLYALYAFYAHTECNAAREELHP